MHGCYDSCLIFGCNENNRNMILDNEWLTSKYPQINAYGLDVIRNYLGEACYGISCIIDINTGVPSISEEDKQQVVKFYEEFKAYNSNEPGIKLGYYLCLFGDYETEQHCKYDLDEESDSNADTEEECFSIE